jgi:hypothetical protein
MASLPKAESSGLMERSPLRGLDSARRAHFPLGGWVACFPAQGLTLGFVYLAPSFRMVEERKGWSLLMGKVKWTGTLTGCDKVQKFTRAIER